MEEAREKKEDIIVLDEGIKAHDVDGPGPEYACCWFIYSPLR